MEFKVVFTATADQQLQEIEEYIFLGRRLM